MVEMTASIGQVEANDARSYDLSLTAAQAAESGMKAVHETIEAMEHIRKAVVDANGVVSRLGERSVAIGRILNVIEDVAEQTNLLALNAAILAAQAGEHGKGFSVVAGEIRELAERTASSTREIGGLIQSVQQEVRNALTSTSGSPRAASRSDAICCTDSSDDRRSSNRAALPSVSRTVTSTRGSALQVTWNRQRSSPRAWQVGSTTRPTTPNSVGIVAKMPWT